MDEEFECVVCEFWEPKDFESGMKRVCKDCIKIVRRRYRRMRKLSYGEIISKKNIHLKSRLTVG